MLDWDGWLLFVKQFHFIRPTWLLAFVPLIVIVLLKWRESSIQSWQQYFPEHLKNALTIKDRGWARQLPLKAMGLLLSMAILACAGPSWQREASPFGEDSASLVIATSLSLSMTQSDVAPTRLQRSKHKIGELIELRDSGQQALVAYAGSAHLAMPLTQDSAVLKPFLNALEPKIMPISGANAASILPLVQALLAQSPGSSVVLVSDGIDTQSIEPIADYFASSDVSLILYAVANPQSNLRNTQDYANLIQLGRKSGINLVHMRIDDKDVNSLASLIERNMQLYGDSTMPWRDMGYMLLLPITLMSLLWFRKGWLVQWCFLFTLAGLLGTPSAPVQASQIISAEVLEIKTPEPPTAALQWWLDLWLTRDQQAQRLFNQTRYYEAALRFESPSHKAVAYYYARQYDLSHTQFLIAGDHLSLFNASLSLARQREYLGAKSLLLSLQDSGSLDASLANKLENNLKALNHIIEQIEMYSESQMNTTEGPEESMELGSNAQTSDGVEETVVQELMLEESLSATEIMHSEALAQMWLDRVESDPALFLQNKFHLQLQNPWQVEDVNE